MDQWWWRCAQLAQQQQSRKAVAGQMIIGRGAKNTATSEVVNLMPMFYPMVQFYRRRANHSGQAPGDDSSAWLGGACHWFFRLGLGRAGSLQLAVWTSRVVRPLGKGGQGAGAGRCWWCFPGCTYAVGRRGCVVGTWAFACLVGRREGGEWAL